MPWGLKRYYGTGGLHFITCSCYRRRRLLGTPERRDLLLAVLEEMHQRYHFVVVGYVVMLEHFHLLISEPEIGTPSTAMQAIKLGFARRVLGLPSPARSENQEANIPTSRAKSAREMGHPITREIGHPAAREMGHPDPSHRVWQRRFYDFNLWSQHKEAEKLSYMHQNPVERGLVSRSEDWNWSSFRAYACGESGPVRLNDWSRWEERIRSRVS